MARTKRIVIGLPVELHSRIRDEAARNGRTIAGEISWRFRDVEEKGRVTDEQGN